MKTILEYIQKKHVKGLFESTVQKIDGVDCIMIKDMPGAYIYLTLPTVQKGNFKTDLTGKQKPIKFTVDEMGWGLKVPNKEDQNSPFWQKNSLYEDRKYFIDAYKAGVLDQYIQWFKDVTGEEHIPIGMYYRPGMLYYFDLDNPLDVKTATIDTLGYCCLIYSRFKYNT